jgi:hypothetical protein
MKRLLAITLFVFGAVSVLAADQLVSFSDFSKGLNSHISKYNVPANEATTCENLRINENYSSLNKRPTMALVADFGSASVDSLYKYYKTDNTDYLIGTIGTTLVYNNSGTPITLKSGMTDGARWQFLTYQDILIGSNGTDKMQKWDGKTQTTADTDGSRTAGDLTTEVGAPFSELNTGTNLDASSWYQYKVVFYDGTTYRYCTTRSNPILTGAAVYNISLTDIPLGPTGTTHRYVYRTVGKASRADVLADTSYYLDKDLAGNTTTTWNDNVTDATLLGDAAPTWETSAAGINVTPPTGKYIELIAKRIFVAGNATYPSEVYWSEPYRIDYFDVNNYEKIREDDGGGITFLKTFGGILRIGKTTTIQSFYTDDSDDSNWYCSLPLSYVGCLAPYSVQVTPKGIFYCGWHGLYSFVGDSSQLISDAVTPDVLDINPSAMGEVTGVYFNNEYQLAYESSAAAEGLNNRVLIYNLIRDAYVKDTKYIKSFAVLDGGTDTGALYSGSSKTDGYVYAHESNLPTLRLRLKSELDAGTYDDTRSYGVELSPLFELAWDCTINGWLTELQTKSASINTINDIVTYLPTATIDRPDTDGTWTSPVYDLGVGAFNKLYWNESLNTYGNITWQVRAGATSSACTEALWSTAVSSPAGSDLSSATAGRYIQLRVNFSTTNINYSPTLYSYGGYVAKLTYSTESATTESAFTSLWEKGWEDLEPAGTLKLLKRVRIYYEGEVGSFTFGWKNEEGDIDRSLTVDLTINPDDVANDAYTGIIPEKVYEYWFAMDTIGQLWWFSLSDTSVNSWKIKRIELLYEPMPIIQ